MLGFAWMHFTREPSSSSPQPRPQLRHALRNTIQQWKPHSTSSPNNPDKQQLNEKQQSTNNKHSLLIPRFDTRKYVSSWEKNARNAALQQIGQTHPKSVALEEWNFPIAFRSFPYARQTFGPIKNLDSDYGGLTYHSIKMRRSSPVSSPKMRKMTSSSEALIQAQSTRKPKNWKRGIGKGNEMQ